MNLKLESLYHNNVGGVIHIQLVILNCRSWSTCVEVEAADHVEHPHLDRYYRHFRYHRYCRYYRYYIDSIYGRYLSPPAGSRTTWSRTRISSPAPSSHSTRWKLGHLSEKYLHWKIKIFTLLFRYYVVLISADRRSVVGVIMVEGVVTTCCGGGYLYPPALDQERVNTVKTLWR